MMAHGVGEVVSEHGNAMKMVQNSHNHQTSGQQTAQQNVSQRKNVGVMGSRRIFAAAFKLKVLDSYRNDIDCRGNQRATARKYGIHRRQIQKWLQCEDNLRSSCAESNATTTVTSTGCCEVPVGSNSGVTASPGSNVSRPVDPAPKIDSIITSSSSSLSNSSSSSLINSNSNTSHLMNCNVITSIGVVPSSGTAIPTPVLVGTTAAAPALNLSLARLHGDEQQHHQQAAPPPHHLSVPPGTPMRHSVRRASSPHQYLQHSNNTHNHHQVPSTSSPSSMPLRGMHVPYDNKSLQHQAQSHQRHSRRQQPEDDREMTERLVQNTSCSPEIKYSYVMTRPNHEGNDVFANTVLSRSTNSDGYYQGLESYHKTVGFVSNLDSNKIKEIGSIDGPFSSYREKNADVTGSQTLLQHAQTTSFASSASSSSSSASRVLHATTIKSERASPDSLATPTGPCETPGSPESAAMMPRPRLYHDQHQHRPTNRVASQVTVASSDTRDSGETLDVCTANTRNDNHVGVANTATGSAAIATTSVAVHSNETTRLAHVHVRVDSHASESRLSEKRQREIEHQHREGIKVEYEEGIRRTRVKEEVAEGDENETAATTVGCPTVASSPTASSIIMARMDVEPKREMSEEKVLLEDSRYHRESTRTDVIASCPDYQASARTTAGLSSMDSSGPVSPVAREVLVSYPDVSSPRAASSSGISTSSSCSDSEIDPLDYSSNSTRTGINDLSRRRSFSLRFKLDVLDAFHSDIGVAGNQRATARKFGINRRQVQKWLGQESELRGEIALRGGDRRQRLGPMPENNNESSSAVDLRTSSSTISSVSGIRSDAEFENSSSPLYCCDVGSSSQKFAYYQRGSLVESSDVPSRPCTLSCCVDSLNGNSMMCYQEFPSQRRSSSGYPESQGSLYCYSPRDPSDNGNEAIDVTISTSPLKRSACTLSCCYDILPSPKRICSESIDKRLPSPMCQEQPPQEVPLCLVKPKGSFETLPMQTEPVTSTVPTPPAQHVSQPVVTSSNKKDAILFKPYLDNPVSKPTEETHLNRHNKHGGLSPLSAQSVIINNNNNCHGICNLNEDRTLVSQQHDYALELSLRVPVTWATHHGGYGEFPERLRSAFVRYPTSPHYT